MSSHGNASCCFGDFEDSYKQSSLPIMRDIEEEDPLEIEDVVKQRTFQRVKWGVLSAIALACWMASGIVAIAILVPALV